MKKISEVMQKTIKTAMEYAQILNKEKELINAPLSIPGITGDDQVAELQIRLASLEADKKREKELHEVQLIKENLKSQLDTLVWISEAVGEKDGN